MFIKFLLIYLGLWTYQVLIFFTSYDLTQILQNFALRKFVHILVKLLITNVFITFDNLVLN